MKLAVMQPYLFPYIGYYQLLVQSDIFVLYDDVTFIKNGFINRNRLKINNEAWWFTLPVSQASSHSKIYDIQLLDSRNRKIKKSVLQNYSRAPHFDEVYPIFCRVIDQSDRHAVSMAEASLRLILDYLNLEKKIIRASALEYDRSLPAHLKLISLAKLFDCDHYVNSAGGKALYEKKVFAELGVQLSFLIPALSEYAQGNGTFIRSLSMIDHLMWCSKDQVLSHLEQFTLE